MNVNVVKMIKMQSNCRHLYLFILLFSVVSSLISAEYQSESKSDGGGNDGSDGDGKGAVQFGPPILQFKTKNNNRDLSEISVRKPQQTHYHHDHHHHHHHHHNQHHTHQQSAPEPQHHLRHQFSHDNAHRSRSNGIHHKQHNHQSNDSAFNRVSGSERQAHSPKKYAQNDDNNAPASSRVGVHFKNPILPQQSFHLTTMGPLQMRPYDRRWPASNEKKNGADNLSRSRQAPLENTHSSISRNRTINPYIRSRHSPRHPTTTTSTTTTTTTTTVVPDLPEKIFFDVQSSFNNIENDMLGDNLDYDFDYSETTYDTKKRSPPSGGGGPFDRDDRPNQLNSENFQRDDPVRSSSSYNGITTSAFKSQHSSNGDNYQLNVNNDGSTNNRPTIETSKSLGNDVKTSNLMTRNIQTRNGILTEEKFKTLGTADAVKKTFNTHFHRYDQELVDKVNAHIRRVSQEGSCRPKLKVISIPHNPMKTFSPHCTVLHRCSDDTGCCHSDYSTCHPRRIENVSLPFWVATRGVTQPEIEILTFENHTECRCILKSTLLSNGAAYRTVSLLLQNDDPVRRSSKNGDSVRRVTSMPERATTITTTTEKVITSTSESPSNCRCPNSFTLINGNQCKCDCSVRQSRSMDMCTKLKTGIEHFSILERRCILAESCAKPTCAYGEYDVKVGKCPREDEALTFSSNALNSD